MPIKHFGDRIGGGMGKRDEVPRVQIESRAEWRAWLMANHGKSDGICLVSFKKHCGERYVSWGEIVQELLCFGWIDSTARRVDDDRKSHYVLPRKKGSMWSRVNKNHVARLIDAGLMAEAGLATIASAKVDGSWTLLDDVEDLIMPPDLVAAFEGDGEALANYEAFSKSAKKGLLWWIKSAKREATRIARITKTVQCAAGNTVANQPGLKVKPRTP